MSGIRMRRKSVKNIIIGVAVSLVVVSCSTVAFTGRCRQL